jgi:hypothetical protein
MAWSSERLEAHNKQQIEQWTKTGIKAKGKEELISHFRGEVLTKPQAIQAHCYQCMGGYGDGEDRDCKNHPCPMYPHNHYNPGRIKAKRDVSRLRKVV